MPSIRVLTLVNAGQLYDEIVAAHPELAPTPTGPDGKLEAKFIIEQIDSKTVLVHLPDDVDVDLDDVERVVKGHKRKPERTFDRVAEARKRVKQKADQGDIMAQDIMTLLGA